MLILRDIILHDRRSFRDLLTGSAEGISAPVLSRRLGDLVKAGFLTKSDVTRGKQGKYSLTDTGLATVPLLIELGRLGACIDPSTRHNAPDFGTGPAELATRIAALRDAHGTSPQQ
jgi:transcriptional regulator, hxlR family